VFPKVRLKRLRRTRRIRDLVRETVLTPKNFVYPIFLDENIQNKRVIKAMPGQYRHSLNNIPEEISTLLSLDISAVLLFGIPKIKDENGSSAYDKDGIVQRAVRSVKKEAGDKIVVITDVCLCAYTNHGHCGVISKGKLLNDPTLDILKKISVSHAEAGADIVAPSGMIDGQVGAIRESLDQNGFTDVSIMAYSAKYASSLYGPFRKAVNSYPLSGDRKNYQMDFANGNEAIREAEQDVKEGADIIMIKPALPYLDLIHRLKKAFLLPIAAYNVSGEYLMVKAASEKGWIDEKSTALEILTSIKRAGADIIITYFAKDVAKWLRVE
jgi:porphobilinogen synthase